MQQQETIGNNDIFEFIGTLWRRKLLLIGSGLLGGIIAAALAFTTTPVYRAQILLSPTVEQSDSPFSGIGGSLAGLAGIKSDDNRATAEALAMLTSRSFTERMIAEEKLLPRIFYEDWDARGKSWTGDYEEAPPTLWRAYKKFDRDIRRVKQNDDTGLITLSIDWVDREEAAAWAHMLVTRINKEMQQRAIDDSAKKLDYLGKELEKTGIVELKTAIYSLIESQIKASMVSNVTREYSFKIIDPALVPDPLDKLRPKRMLMIASGLLLGGLLGLLIVIFTPNRSRQPG